MPAESLRVYSEFYRIGPFGKPIPSDSGPTPREILSPAVARNGYASYQIVVSAPPATSFTLHIAENPENTAVPELYREIYVKQGDLWIPDRLERVESPYTGSIYHPDRSIPGQTVQAFWLDIRIPPETPPARFRLEVQLNVGSGWIIYPMEVRVQQLLFPAPMEAKSSLAPAEASSDSTALNALREYLCHVTAGKADPGPTMRQMILRNALQDMALARGLEASRGKQILEQSMVWATGFSDLTPAAWCKAPKRPENAGAEWYLRLRDYLLTGKTPVRNSR